MLFFVLTPIDTAIRSENDDVPVVLYMFDSVHIETKDCNEYSELIEKRKLFFPTFLLYVHVYPYQAKIQKKFKGGVEATRGIYTRYYFRFICTSFNVILWGNV